MNIENKILNGVRTQELIDEIKNRLQNGDEVLNTITVSSATYPEVTAGEPIKVIFGKIKKFLSDLHDKKADFDGVTFALALKADKSEIPTKTSDLTNDSGFITNTVNNLVNYYTKTQTYTQSEVDALIAAIVSLNIKAVETLPTTNISTTTIYLVPSADPQAQNVKDEYINIDGTTAGWERIGSTAIDLSDYVTNEDLTRALADYTTTANLTTLLAAKQNTISDLATIRSGASAGATAYQKPSTGIPKTDLASAVQTSLEKADSAIQDISGKADKVSNATSGHIAALDSNGNLTDSGKTLGKSVPSNAVFTDYKVLQTKNDGTNADGYLLYGADSSDATEGVFKSSHLKYNPYTQDLKVINLNGEPPVSQSMIGDAWDSSHSYVAGDYFTYNGITYKVKVACIGVTPPNSTYYDVINVMDELNTRATTLQTNINNVANARVPYIYERLRPSNGVSTVTISHCFNTGANWPYYLIEFCFILSNSIKALSGATYQDLYDGSNPDPGAANKSNTVNHSPFYSVTVSRGSSYYYFTGTHTMKVDYGSIIRLSANSGYSNKNNTQWYRGRSTSSQIGVGFYCYVRVLSNSASLSVYNSTSSDWPTGTNAYLQRFIVINSGTVEFFVSNE